MTQPQDSTTALQAETPGWSPLPPEREDPLPAGTTTAASTSSESSPKPPAAAGGKSGGPRAKRGSRSTKTTRGGARPASSPELDPDLAGSGPNPTAKAVFECPPDTFVQPIAVGLNAGGLVANARFAPGTTRWLMDGDDLAGMAPPLSRMIARRVKTAPGAASDLGDALEAGFAAAAYTMKNWNTPDPAGPGSLEQADPAMTPPTAAEQADPGPQPAGPTMDATANGAPPAPPVGGMPVVPFPNLGQ